MYATRSAYFRPHRTAEFLVRKIACPPLQNLTRNDIDPDVATSVGSGRSCRDLPAVYVLKDQLKRIWEYKRPAWALKALDQWCALAQESGIPALANFAKSLCRHKKGIINHCRYPIHTGRLKGINNKIKVSSSGRPTVSATTPTSS